MPQNVLDCQISPPLAKDAAFRGGVGHDVDLSFFFFFYKFSLLSQLPGKFLIIRIQHILPKREKQKYKSEELTFRVSACMHT